MTESLKHFGHWRGRDSALGAAQSVWELFSTFGGGIKRTTAACRLQAEPKLSCQKSN
jgi:hypothetical protein